MRSLTRFADKLVDRFAPKASAEAACPMVPCATPGCYRHCCPGKPCGACFC